MVDDTARTVAFLGAQETATARELGAALGVSQPTVSRWLARAGDQVAAIGQARARRYAATRDVRGLGRHWPLYRIDERGQPARAGIVHALSGDRVLFAADARPDWLRGEFAEGLFPGLPWFMDDMRPQGFLGRLLARRANSELGLSADPARWSQDETLAFLLLRGADLTGQFVLGERALEEALAQAPEVIPAAGRASAYVRLAEAVMAGEPAGSSAAGEQPKFTACSATADGAPQPVIVKFTGVLADAPAARRWSDLLRAEHVAGQVLADNGIAAARTELLMAGGRCFLQSARFDRHGAYGRSGLVSLSALEDAHHGARGTWPAAAARLLRDGWISAEDAGRMELCWWFGRLTGNTDMHFGNLGFLLGERLPLRLAPVYDMAPMRWRPDAGGDVHNAHYAPPPPLPEQIEPWRCASRMALDFWRRLRRDPALHADFDAVAQTQLDALAELCRRFGGAGG